MPVITSDPKEPRVSPNAFAPRAAVVACACALAAAVAPAAQAQSVHQVAPGESLWEIAARNGLAASTLAAANGLAADAPVVAGRTLSIPAPGSAAAPPVAGTTARAADGAGGAGPAAGSAPATAPGPTGGAGSVVVGPGDSLSTIAGRAGVTVARLAAYNGLSSVAPLAAGRALALPAPGSSTPGTSDGGAPGPGSSGASPAAATTGAPATRPASSAAPGPVRTPAGTRVTAADVGTAATANGVPASLARAIAWQESGFDNGAVSSMGARGVMQVMPRTWGWIDSTLSTRRLDPTSAVDNVHAGTLYLQHLLRETGGDPDQAAAAYYQGLASVRSRGLYDDTKRYVENVRALRSRFGD